MHDIKHDNIILYETLPPQVFICFPVVHVALCIFIFLIHLNLMPWLLTILSQQQTSQYIHAATPGSNNHLMVEQQQLIVDTVSFLYTACWIAP